MGCPSAVLMLGSMEGKGEFSFADGSKYVGDMVDGE